MGRAAQRPMLRCRVRMDPTEAEEREPCRRIRREFRAGAMPEDTPRVPRDATNARGRGNCERRAAFDFEAEVVCMRARDSACAAV